MALNTNQVESTLPHRLAVAIVFATFPLVWVGGLVTTHQAGMAVPDWPNTYGYNLFLYPISTWLAGPFDVFIEHGHRLLGALVGLLTITFVIAVFRSGSRAMRWLAIVALVGVCLQGALGGMRVVFDERLLAMIHACVGPAFFAFTVALAALTSRRSPGSTHVDELASAGNRIFRLAVITCALSYLQLILGAQLRHTPVDASASYFRAALHFHLLIAAVLVFYVALLGLAVYKFRDGSHGKPSLSRPVSALIILIAVQLALGGSTWVVRYGWPRWIGEYAWTAKFVVQREDLVSSLIVTGHVAVGSLILSTSTLLAIRAWFVRTIVQNNPLDDRVLRRRMLEVVG